MNLSPFVLRRVALLSLISLSTITGALARDGRKTAASAIRARSYVTHRFYFPNQISTDSSVFWYSGTRGSGYNYITNTSIITSILDLGPSSNFIDLEFNANSHDSMMHPMVMFDRMEHYTGMQSGNVSLDAEESRTYLNDGNISTQRLDYKFPSRTYDGWRQTIAYESGRPVKVYHLQVFPSHTDTVGVRTFRYNTANQLIFDSTAKRQTTGFTPTISYRFKFQPSGQLAKTEIIHGTQNDENRYFRYDSAGRLLSVYRYHVPLNLGEDLSQIDSFEYAPGVYGCTRYLVYMYLSGPSTLMQKRETVVHSLTRGYLPDSMLTVRTDVYGNSLPQTGIRVYYNTNDLPDSLHVFSTEGNSWIKKAWTYYSYERNGVGVGISTPEPAAVSLELFPSPASGPVTLRVPSELGGKDVSIIITDINGRPVYSEGSRINAGLHPIALDDRLIAGQYFLFMRDERGVLIGKARFAKH